MSPSYLKSLAHSQARSYCRLCPISRVVLSNILCNTQALDLCCSVASLWSNGSSLFSPVSKHSTPTSVSVLAGSYGSLNILPSRRVIEFSTSKTLLMLSTLLSLHLTDSGQPHAIHPLVYSLLRSSVAVCLTHTHPLLVGS